LSQIRGVFPQFFIVTNTLDKDGAAASSETSFLGDYDAIESINDASGLPEEILEQNPGILTWESIWGTQARGTCNKRM
jgi:hypothetical protein